MPDMISDPTAIEQPDWSPDPAISWLLTEGRFNDSVRGAFDSYMERLSADGAPISRSALIVSTLHPLVRGWGLRWTRQGGTGLEASFYHATRNAPAYLVSPIHHIHEKAERIRRRLNIPEAQLDYPVLQDMKDQGYTDYIADPLVFSDGTVSVLTFCTEKPEGWTDGDLALIDRLSATLAPVIEAISARRTALILMETYIGKRSGRKVLDGHIRRGDGETINAVVWFNDLRDSTALSEELPMNRMLALMNTYFEISALAIQNNGGEVLRFVGDAMLGIFPVSEETGGETAAAERALRAAFLARDNISEANAERRRNQEPAINFGIGLHIGEVMYGNVGAPARLDFSVIGPAANRAARVESLTKE
ncbi:MAG: adenylate/guanylate cyclase domain-containing protein, partial [Rhodospirillales bacterium]